MFVYQKVHSIPGWKQFWATAMQPFEIEIRNETWESYSLIATNEFQHIEWGGDKKKRRHQPEMEIAATKPNPSPSLGQFKTFFFLWLPEHMRLHPKKSKK